MAVPAAAAAAVIFASGCSRRRSIWLVNFSVALSALLKPSTRSETSAPTRTRSAPIGVPSATGLFGLGPRPQLLRRDHEMLQREERRFPALHEVAAPICKQQ